jgi:LacI family transcriptional regulator
VERIPGEALPELKARSGGPGSPTVTIYDVAAAAGVAISTVSRVLNGFGNPRPETKERVLRAVKDLGFVPNGAARGLSSRTKATIGLVFVRTLTEGPVERMSLMFADSVIRGAERAAEAQGYSLLLRGVQINEAAEPINILTGKTDGLLLLERVIPERKIAELAKRFPVVTVSGSGGARHAVSVRADNNAGISSVVDHLVEHHHLTRLAFVTGASESPDSKQRANAMVSCAAAHGVSLGPDDVWQGDWTIGRAGQLVNEYLDSRKPLPEALVCANDETAIGVMHALMERGVQVPGDVAVVGFDDIPIARYLRPSLSTVNQPTERLGHVAFDTLIAMLSGATPARQILLPTTFIPRGSCGCG